MQIDYHKAKNSFNFYQTHLWATCHLYENKRLLNQIKKNEDSCFGWFSQWLEPQPSDRRVVGSIPSQGHILQMQVWSHPRWGSCGRQPIEVSVSCQFFFSLSPPLFPLLHSLKINEKNNLEWGLKNNNKYGES